MWTSRLCLWTQWTMRSLPGDGLRSKFITPSLCQTRKPPPYLLTSPLLLLCHPLLPPSEGLSVVPTSTCTWRGRRTSRVSGFVVHTHTHTHTLMYAVPASMLNRYVEVNPDPQGRSDRPEWCYVHYNHAYRPNCAFQLEFQWMVTTMNLLNQLVSR